MSESIADISVIIPCYNAEPWLAEALHSVFAQTARPREILFIDDKSTDRSVDIARSFGPTVRIMTNPMRGPGAARYVGVREAKGKYIAFIDADDVIAPSKHEQQLAVLENSDPHTLVHTGSILYWPDGSKQEYQRKGADAAVGQCTQVIFERNPVCGASTMLQRSVILELGNYDPELFGTEDFGMSLLASACCDFVYLSDPLYRMRQHTTNITRRSCHMAYVHWLAQEKFRLRCPSEFARLPVDSVQQFMIDPVLRTTKEAYWRRERKDYARLLQLAYRLAPDDPEIRTLWRRRHVPMSALRLLDRIHARFHPPVSEVQ